MKTKILIAGLLAASLISPLYAATTNKHESSHKRQAVKELAKDQKLHINSVTAKQLAELKGIGAKKAIAIVSYRNEHGKFKTIDDLKQVKGISQKIIDENRDHLTL